MSREMDELVAKSLREGQALLGANNNPSTDPKLMELLFRIQEGIFDALLYIAKKHNPIAGDGK